jgi:hypothetical protein
MNTRTMYQDTIQKIEKVLENPELDLPKKYGQITDLLLFSRVDYLRQVLIGKLGQPIVKSGPFKGMIFHSQAAEGCYIPKLLGCYEEELHPLVEMFSQKKRYEQIINVGCAEGYYAVGLARCMPDTKVLAFDINPKAQVSCKQLAELNQVSEQIVVGGRVSQSDWPSLLNGRKGHTLILSDCEGAEYELLDPQQCPALLQADLLIELHQMDSKPQLAETLLNQYRNTHHIQIIGHGSRNPSQYQELNQQKHLDQLLAVWEFRGGPTPWAYLQVKSEPEESI